jgi:hypothetical protein
VKLGGQLHRFLGLGKLRGAIIEQQEGRLHRD